MSPDDYSHVRFEEQREAFDTFCTAAQRLHLPSVHTGQGLTTKIRAHVLGRHVRLMIAASETLIFPYTISERSLLNGVVAESIQFDS